MLSLCTNSKKSDAKIFDMAFEKPNHKYPT